MGGDCRFASQNRGANPRSRAAESTRTLYPASWEDAGSPNLRGGDNETLRGEDEPMSIHRGSEHIELCSLAESQLSSVKAKQTDLPRDTAIDFTKGALVLFMV